MYVRSLRFVCVCVCVCVCRKKVDAYKQLTIRVPSRCGLRARKVSNRRHQVAAQPSYNDINRQSLFPVHIANNKILVPIIFLFRLSSCCSVLRYDLECTARQCRLRLSIGIIRRLIPAATRNFPVPAIVLLSAPWWTLQS